MNAIFRHLSVRLWMTLLVGGTLLLVLMPVWQRAVGMTWVSVPVVLVLTGCFGLCGWLMNRRGLALIQRLMDEAAVWERAGMADQAEAAFERAKSAFDSFWLSPLQRRPAGLRITRRLARFYLSRPALDRHGRNMVAAYLRMHPGDEPVARGWLEALLRLEDPGRHDHALAERIGGALEDRPAVQRALMAFYLAADRADYEALETYRRVWQHPDPLPAEWVVPLARLLVNENHLNDWALQVYLRGHAMGHTDCLEGIAAGVRLLRPHADNRADLAAARAVLAQLDDGRRQALAGRFQPVESGAPHPQAADRPSEGHAARSELRLLARVIAIGDAVEAAIVSAWRRVPAMGRALMQSTRLRRLTFLVLVLVAVGVVTAVGWQSMGRRPEPAPPPEPVAEVQLPPPVTDPFTIQVAAYLRPEDAQRYVDRLKQQNIDAFSTKAASGSRTWYQVKVSHFPTRDQARQYGEQLKTKGLIDDFYVANFTP